MTLLLIREVPLALLLQLILHDNDFCHNVIPSVRESTVQVDEITVIDISIEFDLFLC